MQRLGRKSIIIFFVALISAFVTTSATVTGEFRVAIDPNQTLSYAFVPTATGTVLLSATFKPIGSKLTIKLFRSDRTEPIAQITGENPIQLSTTIDQIAPNVGYLATIQNVSDRTLSGLVEITYPKANCKELASEFTLDLRYTVETVQMQEEQCAVMRKTLRSLPEKLRFGIEKIIALPQDPEIAGQYIGNTIRIFGDLQGAQLARVFFHEVGHHVQFAHFSPEQQERWFALHKRSGNDPDNFARLYGRTNQFEDFATVYEAYTSSSSDSISIAQARTSRGKTIYLEKIRFLASLFNHQRNGALRTYVYKTEALFGDARILRASVPMDSDNLPQIPDLPDWEEF